MTAADWAGQGRRRRTFAKRIIARDRDTPGYTCPKCAQPIDWTLAWPDPRSASVDHIIERQDGGPAFDPDNAWSMHLGCNTSKGATRAARRRAEQGTIALDPRTV